MSDEEIECQFLFEMSTSDRQFNNDWYESSIVLQYHGFTGLRLLCVGCSAKFKKKSSLFVHKRRHESKIFEVDGKFTRKTIYILLPLSLAVSYSELFVQP